jgi:hypothetical protein
MKDLLSMFVPLTKADAAQRLVYGSFDETPDRAGETFDYASSKDLIKAWSDERYTATNGQSYGNVRGQHANIAAGKLIEIVFDDLGKSVGFVAKIVDDNEWKKVEEGVYSGFSPGGKYAKRWQDGLAKRYTADVRELSIVDVPCNPNAGFTMVKADGTEEQVEFVMSKAYEPGNEATKARADDMAKAVGPEAKSKDYVVQARADLIAENATAELAKMHEPEAEPVVKPEAKPDLVDAVNAALAKGAKAIADLQPVPVTTTAENMAKGLAELATAHEDNDLLAKGLRGISSLSQAIYRLVAVQSSIEREAQAEGDGSAVPAQVVDGIKTLCDALCAMAMEETAELLADIAEAGMEAAAWDYSDYGCAAGIVDLVKADTALMEKAGARNSKGDKAKIQQMHDNAVSLGAECGGPDSAEKSLALATDNERLSKALGDFVPQIETLTKTIETQGADLTKANARIIELEALPALGKGNVIAITKEQDNAPVKPLAKTVDDDIASMPNGPDKANAILRKVGMVSLR